MDRRLLTASQGNPGALEVMIMLSKANPIFFSMLYNAMADTDSQASGLWLLYKDVHNYDLDKLHVDLVHWVTNKNRKPLEDYAMNKLSWKVRED